MRDLKINTEMSEKETLTQVERYLGSFRLSVETLQDISSRLTKDLIRGLDRESHEKAPVKMLPTFVSDTPNGTEEGDFLALDLGGTKLRALYVRVTPGQQKLEAKGKKSWHIPEKMKKGTGDQLFNFIADCLGDFLEQHGLKDKVLPLGLTFSFPCEPKAIDESVLICWVKGFECSGAEGKDVVQLLKDAVDRRGKRVSPEKDYKIESVVMANDTVGAMMMCAYEQKSCEISMVIATGTNACYMEEMCNVKYLEGEDGRMCINTEWGGFGDDGSLKDIQTEFDRKVDENSNNKGEHIFEKMTSGMYLGEIVRLLLVKLTEEQILFQGQVSEKLREENSFTTKSISEIEHEVTGSANTEQILSDLGLQWSPVDLRAVHLICDTVSSRAARLCGAALAAIADRIRTNRGLEEFRTTVAVDGTVYTKHPNFSSELKSVVQELAPQCYLDFQISKDSTGIGAAMVAAVARRISAA